MLYGEAPNPSHAHDTIVDRIGRSEEGVFRKDDDDDTYIHSDDVDA